MQSDNQWRVSAVTENIFFPSPSQEGLPVAAFDPRSIVASLGHPSASQLRVRPMEVADEKGNVVDPAGVLSLLRPGVWVDVSCRLRV